MPELSEIHYSREACIEAVRDYYHFLTRMYLDATDVIEPPEEGWPSITRETLADVGKTDEVISLLRHLPYIDTRSGGPDRIQGASFCSFADWQGMAAAIQAGRFDGEGLKVTTESGSLYDVIPPHVAGLTEGPRDNRVFLVDTELGIILWYECPDDVAYDTPVERVEDDAYDYEPDEAQAEWRGGCQAWAIPDFFEVLKDQFRRLKFVPVTKTKVYDDYEGFELQESGLMDLVREIYRKHHWPDLASFRKEECLAEIRVAIRRHYPDYYLD